MWKSPATISLFILFIMFSFVLSGCEQKNKELIIYSGKGLEKIMEKVKKSFEEKHNLKVEMIYAGSTTLLSTITKTRTGDVFIPGSVDFINMAGDLIHDHQLVTTHVPAFAVRKDNPKSIESFEDLLQPGIKIATGNKKMCAIGKISERIIHESSREVEFAKNISISGSTVNELLDLVLYGEVDASLIWGDMLQWPEAKDLNKIKIPQALNRPQKIHIAVLSTAADKKAASLFADFVATKGKPIFEKHGFGE